MKPVLTTSITHLKSAVALAVPVIEKRNTIPILGNLLFCDGSIIATDLDMEVIVPINECDMSKDDDFTVCADDLSKWLTSLKSDLTITASIDDGDSVIFECGREKLKLRTLPVEDFPAMRKADFEVVHTTDAARMAEALALCSGTISKEVARYYLNGIFFTQREGNMALISTDGHCMTRVVMDFPMKIDFHDSNQNGFIMSEKTVKYAHTKMLKNQKGQVKLWTTTSGTTIRLTMDDGTTLTSKCIDGTYPDYSRFVPALDGDTDFTMNVSAASDAFARLVKMDFGAVRVSITAKCFSSIDVNRQLSVNMSGHMDPFNKKEKEDLGINSKYGLKLMKSLGAIKVGTVRINTKSATCPILILPVGRDDITMVCMPMRL